ncbi:Tyrosine-protein kinase YwqD [Maioricimonas rarisocia]|uniref:Tyrosine-protein kinase YwqD n=1 Tax=Maioricimonas rarisocia TaxID=2528026 RepID=A0A517ZD73_9PLAN|nr:CpsD/CapB family tyrosine-protein kinase [Maioricimonas rarisocia]QDU40411.1 Tyrosine-protein kinase YwqD [Maioricimonas rarisocia]
MIWRPSLKRLMRHFGPIVDQVTVRGGLAKDASFGDRRATGILVASAESREGRSSTALGLALAAARLKQTQNVVLIDGDLRHGDITRKFGLEQHEGFRELLAGTNGIAGLLAPTSTSNLHVMPCGKAALDWPDILLSSEAEQAFGLLREQADFVVVDSPAVNQFPEGRLLAQWLDSVILVVRTGRSRAEAVNEAREVFSDKLIGAVVTRYRRVVPGFIDRYF